MAYEFGELSYTLTGLYICRFNIVSQANEGNVVLVEDGQMFVAEPEADNDKLRGYGKYTHGLSVPIGCKVSLKGGGWPTQAMAIIAGASAGSSNTSPNRQRILTFPAGGAGLGYFSVISAAAAENGALVTIGHRAVMLDTVPKYTAAGEENKFNLWETDGYSFPQGTELERLRSYETAGDFTAPSNAAAFDTYFTASF